MSDGTTLNPGTGGDTIVTDDLGTAKAAVSKLMLGADGVDGGLVTTSNPLPVEVQNASIAVTGSFYQATQPVSAASLPLPTGASTAALQTSGNASLTSLDGKVTACNTGAVVVSSGSINATCSGTVAISGSVAVTGPLTDAELRAVAVPVSGTFWQATQPVSGTVTANQGGTWSVTASQGTAANLLCTASQGGTWTVQPGNTANTTPWLVKEYRAATGTTTSVAGSASSVSLLASNANRLGAIITNDSTAILYVKLGSTASTTSYAYKLYTDDTVEIPYGYTGAIDGIWASATGNARITELT